MDEASLRALLERAVADDPPAGPIVSRALEAGVRFRRRRRVRGAVAVAVVVVAAGAAIPALRTGSRQAPASTGVSATLYVSANYDGDTAPAGRVSPISAGTGIVGRPIEAGESDFLVSSPDGRTLYVLSNVSGWVRPISTVTQTAGPAIRIGQLPIDMAITPDGKTLYVAGDNFIQGQGSVTAISLAAGKVAPPIQVGEIPDAIAVTPDGKTVYVLSTGPSSGVGTFSGPGTVTPISTATDTAGPAITVGKDPGAMAITPDGKTLYVANGGSDTVTPISIATGQAGRPIKVGHDPSAMAITPDGKTLYVSNPGSDTVTPISVATNTAGPPITVGPEPDYPVITPDGKAAYVLCAGPGSTGTVTEIVTATNRVGKEIRIADAASGRMVLVP